MSTRSTLELLGSSDMVSKPCSAFLALDVTLPLSLVFPRLNGHTSTSGPCADDVHWSDGGDSLGAFSANGGVTHTDLTVEFVRIKL